MTPPARPALDSIEPAIWAELACATARVPAGQPRHAWRTPVLATVDARGEPQARTVVLREVLPAERQLLMYTDARSPKCAELAAQPLATLLFWSPELGQQLRVRVRCRLDTSGLAVTSRWARLEGSTAVQDYIATLAPGTPLDAEQAAASLASRSHFALLTAQVLDIDCLQLAGGGHWRAGIGAQGAQWLQP